MKKELLFYGLKLIGSLILVFGIQVIVLQQLGLVPNYNLLVSSYLINFLLAFLIVSVIGIYINNLKSYIGFLFMIGSFLKFGVFFIWFYPICKQDGNVDGYEFSMFFVPYIVSLLLETFQLKKMLEDL